MASIILFGAGSPILGDVVDTCTRLGHSVAAVVQNVADAPPEDLGVPVVRPSDLTATQLALCVAIPLFRPANREVAWAQVHELGARRFDALVDPTVVVSPRATVEEGAYINAGAVLGPRVRVGRFVFVNRGALVGHHVELGDFASLGPGANIGSHARIGRGAVVGTGAVIAAGITVGARATVGVGAVALRDVPDGATVLGNPARVVRESIQG